LILRGIFTLRSSEIEWFYQKGASHLFPEYWEEYLSPIPKDEQHDLVTAYYKRLTGHDEANVLKCAKAWSKWECATSKLFVGNIIKFMIRS
jgi:proline iminopeptidase